MNDEIFDVVKHAQTKCTLVLEIAPRLKFCLFEILNFVASIEACPGLNVLSGGVEPA
jgi:hypothetical protein